MIARAALGLVCALATARACGESEHHADPHAATARTEDAPPTPAAPPPAPTLRAIPEPTAPVEAPEPTPTRGTSRRPARGTPPVPPERGCVALAAPRSIFGATAVPYAIGLESGHAVAAYAVTASGADLVVITAAADGSEPHVLARFAITPAITATQLVPPALARIDAGHLGLATIDAERHVTYREIDRATGAVSDAVRVDETNVDLRFPAAVAAIGDRRLVAYTETGDPQRVKVVVLDGSRAIVARHDVTPPSAGGVSPAFVRDATPPYLVLVDPHYGFSLTHAIAFDRSGAPGEDKPLQPIVGLIAPARVVAAITPSDLEIAFLARGQTNHMGAFVLASHASTITPRELVPPSDYTRLWVDALGASYGAITVSLAPHGGETNATREAVIRVADGAGVGPELVIVPTRGSAIYPMLSRDDAGHLALVHGAEYGIDVVPLACRGAATP